MKEKIDKNLNDITEIWNQFIWKYKFCQSKIKFNEDAKSNYFGDIIRYFDDTFEMIYQRERKETFRENFKESVSFFQLIYIHQDFIEELLNLFGTGINKDKLKEDINYSLNREIRNELIGHPIRKKDIDGKNRLLSSTIFSNNLSFDYLRYIKYHREDDFEGTHLEYKFEEVLKRHEQFLMKFTEKILNKLWTVLRKFKKNILNLQSIYTKIPFTSLIKLLSHSFEDIFEQSYVFQPNYLLEIYERRTENFRYQNVIDVFYFRLNISLNETRILLNEFLNEQRDEDKDYNSILNFDKLKKINLGQGESLRPIEEFNKKQSYPYALDKLFNKSKRREFGYFSGIIRAEHERSPRINIELDHMEKYIENDLEYYSGCLTLWRLLLVKEEDEENAMNKV